MREVLNFGKRASKMRINYSLLAIKTDEGEDW
jgi:hypothetical protein